jgi:hypothetical protein
MPYYSGDSGDYLSTVQRFLKDAADAAYDSIKNNSSYTEDGGNDPYDTYYDQQDSSYGGDYGVKKEKGPVPLDYSVLSVGILTLGLILFVEIVRHQIDHAAHGRPFFKSVLLMVYSECTLILF